MNIKIFLKECNKREVFKLLSIYVVSSWVILQVLSVIAQPLSLPEKSITFLILLLIIGFPLYIIYIWKSRLAKSWKSDEDDSSLELIDKRKFRHMYFSILGAILFLSGLGVVIIIDNAFSNGFSIPKITSNDKIAILTFSNNTSNEELDIVGKMTTDWISHGITQNNAGQVITQDIIKDYTNAIKTQSSKLTDNDILNKYFKPSKRIIGSYFLKNNKLIFTCSIVNGTTGETLFSFDLVECNSENPLDCIEELRQDIVGFLVIEKAGKLSLENKPPKYEAYKTLLDAKANNREGNIKRHVELLDKAIKLDSNFFEPKALKIDYYYNYDFYSKADSLIHNINQSSGLSNRQKNILDMFEAIIDGDNRKVYNFYNYEYNIIPYDLDTNTSYMIYALQFVNKPEDVEAIFNEISIDDFSVENCLQCVYRIYIMAMANNELKKYSKTIKLLEPNLNKVNDVYYIKPLIRAYISTNNKVKADDLLQKLKLKVSKKNWLSLNLFTARQFLLLGKNKLAKPYLNIIINAKNDNDQEYIKGEAQYEIGNYIEAEKMFSKLQLENPKSLKIIAYLGKCYIKNGKPNKAKNSIDSLEKLRAPYQYGEVDYRIAMIYAAQNDEENVFKYLLQSIAAGNFYTSEGFKNNANFTPFLNSDKFETIMNYWH